MKNCLMYLRKSRSDRDFAKESIGLTLKRHKDVLMEYAMTNNLHIEHVYEEIVSGDSIASRPEMQKLLEAIESGKFYGVLVVDLQRLGRGNSIDQGIIQNTFKFSGTKIITPNKVYDFSDDFDEEYSEFELFMGRKEYKMVKRRLINGRLASVREGKYPGGTAPYGYETYKLKGQKGYSLRIIPEQAHIVRMIYDWYINGVPQADGTHIYAGCRTITRALNRMGYVDQNGNPWTEVHVQRLLTSEVYTGKVVWYKRKEVQRIEDGRIVKSVVRQDYDDRLVCDGLHEAIIDEATYNKAATIRKSKRPHISRGTKMRNPFASVIYCKKCGSKMWMRSKDQRDYSLFCPNLNCKNRGVYLGIFEDRFLEALNCWIDGYINISDSPADMTDQISALQLQASALESQKQNLHNNLTRAFELVESGIYDTETFVSRSKIIKDDIAKKEASLQNVNTEILRLENYQNSKNSLVPRLQSLSDGYHALTNERKNEIIISLFDRIEVEKDRGGIGHSDDFKLWIYPKVPKI